MSTLYERRMRYNILLGKGLNRWRPFYHLGIIMVVSPDSLNFIVIGPKPGTRLKRFFKVSVQINIFMFRESTFFRIYFPNNAIHCLKLPIKQTKTRILVRAFVIKESNLLRGQMQVSGSGDLSDPDPTSQENRIRILAFFKKTGSGSRIETPGSRIETPLTKHPFNEI